MRTDEVVALPLNVMEMWGQEFLRVTTTYRNGLHLVAARERDAEDARSALHPRRSRIHEHGFDGYDALALTELVWARRTMCGLRWEHMASAAAEIALLDDDPDYRCVTCIGRARRAALARPTNPQARTSGDPHFTDPAPASVHK
jgi:hypothetical protein